MKNFAFFVTVRRVFLELLLAEELKALVRTLNLSQRQLCLCVQRFADFFATRLPRKTGDLLLLLAADPLSEEVVRTLVDPWESRVFTALLLSLSLYTFPLEHLLFEHPLVRLKHLKVQKADLAADTVPLETIGARKWLQAVKVDFLLYLLELPPVQHLSRVVQNRGSHY